jgi:predicted site-specific integrase-resolvase
MITKTTRPLTYLRLDEVAEQPRVTPQTIRRWLREGRLPRAAEARQENVVESGRNRQTAERTE